MLIYITENYGIKRHFQQYLSYIVVVIFFLVVETGVPGENHQPTGSHRKTLSHNVVSSTPRLSGIRTPSVSSDRQYTSTEWDSNSQR